MGSCMDAGPKHMSQMLVVCGSVYPRLPSMMLSNLPMDTLIFAPVWLYVRKCYSDMQQLDDAWQQAKALCETGELPGVCSMLASTAASNTSNSAGSSSSASASDTQSNAGVIFMQTACGQESEQVLATGRNIVKKMKYTTTTPFMYWKAASQAAGGSGSQSNADAKTRCVNIIVPFPCNRTRTATYRTLQSRRGDLDLSCMPSAASLAKSRCRFLNQRSDNTRKILQQVPACTSHAVVVVTLYG